MKYPVRNIFFGSSKQNQANCEGQQVNAPKQYCIQAEILKIEPRNGVGGSLRRKIGDNNWY